MSFCCRMLSASLILWFRRIFYHQFHRTHEIFFFPVSAWHCIALFKRYSLPFLSSHIIYVTSCQSCQTLLSEAWHQSQASLQLYFLSCQSDIWSFSSWGTDIIKVTNYLLVVISVGTCCLINPNVHQCSLWHHSSYNFCQAVCRSGPMSPGLCPGD